MTDESPEPDERSRVARIAVVVVLAAVVVAVAVGVVLLMRGHDDSGSKPVREPTPNAAAEDSASETAAAGPAEPDAAEPASSTDSAPAGDVVDASAYRSESTGAGRYTWLTADRRILCQADDGQAPICYLAGDRAELPPFTETAHCPFYEGQGVNPADSSVLYVGGEAGPCHTILQGAPGSLDADGRFAEDNQATGERVKILPDGGAIVVPTAEGDVRCASDPPRFGCEFADTGRGYTVSPSEAVFTA